MYFDEFYDVLVSFGRRFPDWMRLSREKASSWPVRAGLRLILLCTVASVLRTTLATADESLKFDPADPLTRVDVVLEVEGILRIKQQGKQSKPLPIKATGSLQYDERQVSPDAGTTVRHLRRAEADIKINGQPQQTALREDRLLVVSHVADDEVLVFSPLGPLTREELDLLEMPAHSAVVNRLLPEQEIRVKDDWEHSDRTLAALLNLDDVSHNDVRSTLGEVDGGIARIELEGTVRGTVDDATTDIEIKGKYNFDLNAGRIVWLALAMKEKRTIGQALPGFDVVARLRMQIAPVPDSPLLMDESLPDVTLKPQAGSELLDFQSSRSGFKFLHGRRWHVITDRSDVTVLRLFDLGQRIGQCNVSRLPDMPAGKHITLERFQQDIRKALAKNFGQFTSASQETSDSGTRQLRVVVSGEVSEVPITWIYYHLSDRKGRRAAYVFTFDAKQSRQFGDIDREVVSSFQFVESPVTTEKAKDVTQRNAGKLRTGHRASGPRLLR